MSEKSWPMLEQQYGQPVKIWHAQAWAGNPDLHDHDITIAFGWKRAINPHYGHTWSVYESGPKVEKLCALVHEKNLNELVRPYQPTIETLAGWLLARATLFDWIEISAYGGYRVRLSQRDLSDFWRKAYLGSDAPEALTV